MNFGGSGGNPLLSKMAADPRIQKAALEAAGDPSAQAAALAAARGEEVNPAVAARLAKKADNHELQAAAKEAALEAANKAVMETPELKHAAEDLAHDPGAQKLAPDAAIHGGHVDEGAAENLLGEKLHDTGIDVDDGNGRIDNGKALHVMADKAKAGVQKANVAATSALRGVPGFGDKLAGFVGSDGGLDAGKLKGGAQGLVSGGFGALGSGFGKG